MYVPTTICVLQNTFEIYIWLILQEELTDTLYVLSAEKKTERLG